MADLIDMDAFKHRKTPGFQADAKIMQAYEDLGHYIVDERPVLADVLDALDALNEAITAKAERLKG